MGSSWNKITKEKLRYLFLDKKLSDKQIAELYGVTASKVRYKRGKFGISIYYNSSKNNSKESEDMFSIIDRLRKK